MERSFASSLQAVRRVFRRLGTLRTLAFAFALLPASAEVFLRLVYRDVLRLQQYPLIYEADDRLGYRYRPASKARICHPSVCKDIAINEGGYLGPVVPRQKSPGTLRVALIDSSNGTGIWQNEGQEYARHLETMLRGAGHSVDVLNFSVDGVYRSAENVQVARARAEEYSPDLMLLRTPLPFLNSAVRRSEYRGYVIMYPGDLAGARREAEAQVDFIEAHVISIAWYRASYCVRAATRWFMHHTTGPAARYATAFVERRWVGPLLAKPSSLRQSIGQLLDLQRLLEARNGRLVLFDDRRNVKLRETAVQHGLDFVGLEFPEDVTMRHEHDRHWNDAGHQFVARQLSLAVAARLSAKERTALQPHSSESDSSADPSRP